MTLWLLLMMLCSAAAVAVSVPLIRRMDAEESDAATLVYADQLLELDRDVKDGTINQPEAELAKREIKRRMLASEKLGKAREPLNRQWRSRLLVCVAGVVIVGSGLLYQYLGSPNMASTGVSSATVSVDPKVAQLKAKLKAQPNDAQGWQMLGLAEFNLQNYVASAEAFQKAMALVPTNSDYKSAYAEALVQQAQGIVTPRASALFAEVLTANAKDARARYYQALAVEQSGDQSGALDLWRALLADAPEGAGWSVSVKLRIAELEKATGQMLGAAPVLSDEQKTGVQAMAPQDQQKMIEAMVAKLAAKLATNPKDLNGTIGLMRAYSVLNDPEKAKAALARANAAFAGDYVTLERLKAAADELGLK